MTEIADPAPQNPADEHSEQALQQALWSALVRPALKKANANPYTEDESRSLTGREGIGPEDADTILNKPFYEYADQWRDNAMDYVSGENERACKELIEQALDSREGSALIEAHCERLSAASDEEADEDEIRERLIDSLTERAREDGLDYFYEVNFSLSGSIEASASLSFELPRERTEGGDVLLPDFSSDWCQFLLWLNIDPAAFANHCRDQAKRESARLRALSPEDKEQEHASEQLAMIREWTQAQQLGRACPKAAHKWPGGLGEGARYAARLAISPAQGAPLCSMQSLYELLLSSSDDGVEVELELGMDAGDLTLASELLERFSEGGPLLAARSLEGSLSASPGSVYLNGESLALTGPVAIQRADARFTDNSGDGSLQAADAANREMAMEASSLCWGPSHLLNDTTSDEDFAEGLTAIAEKARSFGARATPAALDHSLAAARLFKPSAESPSALAQERLELYRHAFMDQMEAGAREGAARKKTAPAPKTADPALHQLIEINAFGRAQSSQWRHSAKSLIAKKAKEGRLDEADAFGNTLLIKAMRCVDLSLCKTLLQAGASPNAQNLNGDTVWSAFHSLKRADALRAIELMAPFGMASWRDEQGSNLMHGTIDFEIALALAKIGVNPGDANAKGQRADWRIVSPEKKAELESVALALCIEPTTSGPRKALAL